MLSRPKARWTSCKSCPGLTTGGVPDPYDPATTSSPAQPTFERCTIPMARPASSQRTTRAMLATTNTRRQAGRCRSRRRTTSRCYDRGLRAESAATPPFDLLVWLRSTLFVPHENGALIAVDAPLNASRNVRRPSIASSISRHSRRIRTRCLCASPRGLNCSAPDRASAHPLAVSRAAGKKVETKGRLPT